VSNQKVATPVPAATILMLRQGSDGLEVFMVVRHHQIDFASGALVFPGGKADAQDFDDALLPQLQGAAGKPDMRAIQVCSIREAFEECGILLAYEANGEMIKAERLTTLEHYRESLHSGETPLLKFLETEALTLACDQLVHYAHWITPDMMPKRFDTHFYLATAPEDHLALHDGYESVDSVWLTPEQGMADAKAGTRTVIFPTLCQLEKLAKYSTVEDAMAATVDEEVVAVLPWTEKRDDGNYICIPAEAGYPVSDQKMPERSA
jgi:8-oxo-dGTP pyrophosphatase MutT (NUDIX family)